ncbi:hypothetical protein MMC11_008088 [Xylographa trunciseda]|nr:hypothetical protein [Xylographa trunciseda]
MVFKARRAFAPFLIIFANVVSASLSSGVGVVGQGRSLFTPTCGFACLDSFWSLTLSCSESDVGTTFSINTPACHASSAIYLENLAWCLRQRCPGEGLTNAQLEDFWLNSAGDGLQVGPWSSYLTSEPTETLNYGATILNTPSLANSTLYDASTHSILSYAEQEKYHALWRLSAPPLIKKYLLDPAFIGQRNLQILPWKLRYVPQRSIALLVIIFVAFNVAMNFFNTPSFNNDTWFVSSSTLHDSNLANRLGVLAIANLALAIMLSGRNSILLDLTGCSRTTIITFHRWAGRVAVIKGVAHSAIYLINSEKYGFKLFTPSGALHYIGSNARSWELGIAALLGEATRMGKSRFLKHSLKRAQLKMLKLELRSAVSQVIRIHHKTSDDLAPVAVDVRSDLPTITFIMRPCSGITRRLHHRVARSGAPISLPVLIEGSYGSSAKEALTSETVLAFAGGIGITGILGHLNHYVTTSEAAASKHSKAVSFTRRFVLLWMVASATETEAIMPFFPPETAMRDRGIELHVICKESGANRVDFGAEIVKEKTGLSRKESLCVLVCGPARMADEIRKQVVSAETTEGGSLQLHVEAFAW